MNSRSVLVAQMRKWVAFDRVHAVAHGDDGVQVVELDRSGDLPVAFGLNCFHSGNSYRRRQFAGFEDVLEMLPTPKRSAMARWGSVARKQLYVYRGPE